MKTPEDQNKILDLFNQGPSILENALAGLSNNELDYIPSTGGWTIRQIVHHIVDGNDIWKLCIKMALGNQQAEFNLQWYWAIQQTEWAKCWSYENRSIEISIALLKVNIDHISQLLEHVKDGWSKSIQFRKHSGEIERVSVGAAINIQADHVVHHVQKILAIRQEFLNK